MADESDENNVLFLPIDEDEHSALITQTLGEDEGREQDEYTYEEAVYKTGNGWFHYRLLLISGWALCSDAIEVLCVSFLLPSAECDLNLDSVKKGWLNAMIFVGMMIGNYVWGTLADFQGRRKVLLFSLTTNALGNLLSSFAQSYWLFLAFRLISGIGVGGSLPVVFSYFVEFQPKDRRGSMVSALATFWMAGNMIAPGLAWALIPHNFGYFSENFTYNSWRIFVAICSLPSISSALIFFFMPESPKHLLAHGNENEAINVIKNMYIKNGRPGKLVINHIVTRHDKKEDDDDDDDDDENVNLLTDASFVQGCSYTIKTNFKYFLSSSAKLFKKPLLRLTVILLVVNVTLAFGYYGLWMWFPELFKRMKEHGGSACGHLNNTLPHNTTNKTCDAGKDPSIYSDGFITAAASLPGNLLTVFVMDRVGAKILLVLSMILSGVSVFFIWFVQTQLEGLVMSCIFSGISTIGWNSLDVISVESFPTNVRSSSMGLQQAVARMAAIGGNLAFGGFVDIHCIIPMLMVSILLSIGGLTAIWLPKRNNQDIG